MEKRTIFLTKWNDIILRYQDPFNILVFESIIYLINSEKQLSKYEISLLVSESEMSIDLNIIEVIKDLLKEMLDDFISIEDYTTCANIRDYIKAFNLIYG
jgi:protein-arginine kinase activator protein McsA